MIDDRIKANPDKYNGKDCLFNPPGKCEIKFPLLDIKGEYALFVTEEGWVYASKDARPIEDQPEEACQTTGSDS